MLLSKNKTETALFAGGCFWCSQAAFENLDGVKGVVGYAGGTGENPTYQDYAKKVSYKKLLDLFWMNIDPTDKKGQFADRGPQYKSIIFYFNKNQKEEALQSKKQLENSGKFSNPIVTEIIKASTFYDAEDYHKDFYKKY